LYLLHCGVHLIARLQQEGPHHDSPVAASSMRRRMSSSGGTCPPATFSTCSDWSHSSETPSRCANARLARSPTAVVGLSMPAVFISRAADLTAASAPETLGT